MIASNLFTRLMAEGVELTIHEGRLRYKSKVPISLDLLEEMRCCRNELIAALTTYKPKVDAWLDEAGRLRVHGLIPADCTMLDVLVSLNASVQEIERHIHPIGTPDQWELWTGERIAWRMDTQNSWSITNPIGSQGNTKVD